LLSTLLLDMKQNAADRFMRDTIRGCYGAERFFLLHHTLHDCRPRVQQEYLSSDVSALVVVDAPFQKQALVIPKC
jgi:hypothetical protein